MKCDQCARPIPAEHVNVHSLVAKCVDCDHVFTFDAADLTAGGEGPSGSGENGEPSPASEPPERPGNIKRLELASPIFRGGHRDAAAPARAGVALIQKWRSRSVRFLVFFCLVWNGMMAFMLVGSGFDPMLSLHVAAGLAVAYLVAAMILNKTSIVLDDSNLTVKHSPVPWPGGKSLPRADVREISYEASGSTNGDPRYSVRAELRGDGQYKTLRSHIPEDEAAYITWALNERLNP